MNSPSSLKPIPEADGLRAVAALLVFFYHVHGGLYGMSRAEQPRYLIENLIQSGATGVTLFFLLSGFLLARPFWRKGIQDGEAARFLKNRFLRIYPMYLVIIVIGFLLSGSPDRLLLGAKSIIMLFSANDFFPFSVPWWTLRTEFEFYFLMTLFLISFSKISTRIFFSIFLMLSAAAVYFIYKGIIQIDTAYKYMVMQSALAYLPVFGLGLLLAWLDTVLISSKLLSRRKYWIGDFIVLLLAYLLCMVLDDVSSHGVIALELIHFSHHYFEALCWGGILMVTTQFGSNFNRVLSSKPLRWFGKISYSFYLIHLPVIFFVTYGYKGKFISLGQYFLPFFVASIICFLIASVLAYCSYFFIERPFLRLKEVS